MKTCKKILLALLILTSFNVSSQIDFGIKSGANFATLSDATNNGTKIGFVAGVFGSGKIGKKWALQGELLYSQQGSEFDAFNFNTEYLNVPILVKKYVGLGFNLQFGPQFGFLVNDNADEFDSIEAGFESKNFDLSGVVGLGYDFIFGLRFDARYQFGFTNTTGNSEFSNQNRVFTIAVGYSFL
ncbi:porin family protein [Tenacibaculum tangerinum]|uniref:Porin family protein n=1 Tax=Tenacibaculum tangerinum TaxID=3038772 RepID=A0ABY8L4R5_9FLAO|nr:porin family protein [Tenacibaculum tangerinum]WGH75135.1 porin family protein [Tenacibaculum tangerinum]